MSGRELHRLGTLVLSLLMVIIGIALIVQAAAGDGGVASSLLGALFLAGGLGRVYVERKRGRRT